MGAFSNRENADAIKVLKELQNYTKNMLSYIFLKHRERENWKEIIPNINSVTPECFLLHFMLSYTFHVFKHVLVIFKRKINIKKSRGRWTIPWQTLCQEFHVGVKHVVPERKLSSGYSALEYDKGWLLRSQKNQSQKWSQLRIISWTTSDVANKEPISREKKKDISKRLRS